MVLGEHTIGDNTETNITQSFRVQKIVVHKNKKGKASLVDLALLKVSEEIPLTLYTPLCLPEQDYDIRGQNVTLTGRNDWDRVVWCDPDLLSQVGGFSTVPVPATTPGARVEYQHQPCRR